MSGALAGWALILYGALSLWLGRPSPAHGTAGAKLCDFWICAQPDSDSPTAISPSAEEPLEIVQKRLILNAASTYRWIDLAEAEINADDVARGEFAIRQALAAAPGNPAILFRAANLYLRLEDYPQTFRQLTAVLRNPELAAYDNRAFTLYSQMDLPLGELLDEGIPPLPSAANQFLRFWITQGKLDEAQETWRWINQHRLTNLQSAGLYVDLLGKRSRWDEAFNAWIGYTKPLEPEYGNRNFVFDGNFEKRPVDCPFDWQLHSSAHVSVSRDMGVAYQGASSLRLSFSGTPSATPDTGSVPAVQMTVMKPGLWRLKAMMKTKQLTRNQGVVIRIADAAKPGNLDVVTNTVQGTTDWASVSITFSVKSETKLARVEILCPASGGSDTPLDGTVWVGSVVLEPLDRRDSVGSA